MMVPTVTNGGLSGANTSQHLAQPSALPVHFLFNCLALQYCEDR